MLPLTEWRLQHCSLRGIRAIRLVVASSNSLLSSDSLETGTGSSNSLLSANESLSPGMIPLAPRNSPRGEAMRPSHRHRRDSHLSSDTASPRFSLCERGIRRRCPGY